METQSNPTIAKEIETGKNTTTEELKKLLTSKEENDSSKIQINSDLRIDDTDQRLSDN